jgi:hypothetical protein
LRVKGLTVRSVELNERIVIRKRILASLSFCFALVALMLYGSTFVTSVIPGLLLVFVFFNLIFGILGIVLGRNPGDPKMRLTFPMRFPRWVKPLGIFLGAFCIVSFILVLRGGTPIAGNGRFFKKTASGTMLEISPDEYRRLEATEQRLFSATWLSLDVALGLTLWFKKPG